MEFLKFVNVNICLMDGSLLQYDREEVLKSLDFYMGYNMEIFWPEFHGLNTNITKNTVLDTIKTFSLKLVNF